MPMHRGNAISSLNTILPIWRRKPKHSARCWLTVRWFCLEAHKKRLRDNEWRQRIPMILADRRAT